MKHAVLFFLLISLPAVLAQQSTSQKSPVKTQSKPSTVKRAASSKPNLATTKKTTVAVKPKPKPHPTPLPLSEKEQFDKASAHELARDRVAALEKFLTAFPQSENRVEAAELLTSSRVLIAEEKLISGETADAVIIFKLVVEQVARPIPNDLFSESIAKIPSSLFFRGQRPAALELAAAIETKVEDNAAQLLEIANFHIATENGAEAMRVAAKAAAKDPASAAVQRTIALAHRINFDLELSADAYAKSLELEPDSVASKRGLAEMKRALGRSDEAVGLYRELLAKSESDLQSRNGLILALFEAGKRSDAEAELARSLGQTPGNVVLLSGAAYWYASKGIGDKAFELAEKAVVREPRYVWAHIALARALMSQNKPVEAEQVLIKARAYGNFPTLEYELASARMAAGFFREAAEDLQKQFSVTSSGTIKTNLGGRVSREEKSLFDLVAFERKASIFAPVAADSVESSDALKALLILDQKLQAAQPNETEAAAAADAFAAGSDKMKIHRQIYAASLLLQKHVSPGKVLELARGATGNAEMGLEVANPRAAVMASELYEARVTAFRRNEFLVVPDVPTQTLSAILRGRIEEIAGWAFYQQNNFPDAVVRLRRSISVMPDKSAWWRSSVWRLGAALAAEGKDAEALNFYIESYKTDKPDFAKYSIVEALYRKVNGNIDGLETKLGRDRVPITQASVEIQPSPTPAQSTDVPTANPPNDAPAASGSPTPVAPEPEATTDQSKIPVEKSEGLAKPETAPAQKPSEPKIEIPAKVEPAVIEPVSNPVPDQSQPAAGNENTKSSPETKIPETKTEPSVKSESARPTPQVIEKPVLSDPKAAVAKPLFEPIIITIPNSRPAKPSADASKVEKKDPPSDKTIETAHADKKPADDSVSSGAARPRLIEGEEVKLDETPPCTVGVSQENISLINSGGSVGILVSVDAPGDVKTLTSISSSPKDLELTLQPEIGGITDRRFYVIKSVSSALGIYQVTFATPCGKKEVIVTIR